MSEEGASEQPSTKPKKLTRRQFLALGATATSLVLLERLGIKAITQLAEDHPQKNDLLNMIWQAWPFSSQYSDRQWTLHNVRNTLKEILPAVKADGDVFISTPGIIYTGSLTPFAHASLVKVPIAVDALARHQPVTESDLRKLLVESSGEVQQKILNQRLTEMGLACHSNNRFWLTGKIIEGFGMGHSNVSQGCLADYQGFWQSLIQGEFLPTDQTSDLLRLMSAGKCGGSGHFSTVGACVIPSVPKLSVSGKIGILASPADNKETTYSEIWGIYREKDFSRPLVSAGAFFVQRPGMPPGQALTGVWHLHQLTTALALQEES